MHYIKLHMYIAYRTEGSDLPSFMGQKARSYILGNEIVSRCIAPGAHFGELPLEQQSRLLD